MFKFLKEKIKQAISKITNRVEEESFLEKSSQKEEKEEKLLENSSLEKTSEKEEKVSLKEDKEDKKKGEVKEEKRHKKKVEIVVEKKELEEKLLEKISSKEEKKGFFGKLKEAIVTKKIDDDKFNELFWELELALLENNVAVEVIEKIKDDLRNAIVDKPIKRGEVDSIVERSLKASIEGLFDVKRVGLLKEIKEKKGKPYVIVFFGTNGSGKTTSIAKVAHLLKQNHLSVVLSASDTFRAASIEQLKEWGNRLNVKVISHDYKADPTAVAYDGLRYCQAHEIDALLIDTAGRLHSNKNLMKEMEKIVRVIKPDLRILVAEATTGNDAVNQAMQFNEAVGIDGFILTKADVDEKGGATVSISYVTKKPVLYLGVGQLASDIKEFNKDEVIKSIGLE